MNLVPLIAATFVGGAAGGLGRYALSKAVPPYWGTLAANSLACLLLGFAMALPLSGVTGALVSTGVAGALSTWSTLAKELGGLLQARAKLLCAAYLLGTLAAGFTAFAIASRLAS